MKQILLLGSMLLSLHAGAQTLPAPVARYDFSGGAAADLSGHGLHGTLTGALPPVSGRSGAANTALLFSPGNYVEVSADSLLDLRQWTVSAIVRPDTFETLDCQVSKILQRGSQYGRDYICLELNDNFVDNDCATYTPNSQQPFGAAAGTINAFRMNPAGSLKPGTWYCLTAAYGHDTLKVYVDGTLNHMAYWPDQYGNGGLGYPSAAPLTIGMGMGSGGSTYWFRGAIDEVALYNTALSAGQVAALCAPAATGIGNGNGSQQGSIGTAYPNPAGSRLTVPVKGVSGPIAVRLLQADGRLLLSKTFRLSGADDELQLSTADLAPGIYLLELTAGGLRRTQTVSRL